MNRPLSGSGIPKLQEGEAVLSLAERGFFPIQPVDDTGKWEEKIMSHADNIGHPMNPAATWLKELGVCPEMSHDQVIASLDNALADKKQFLAVVDSIVMKGRSDLEQALSKECAANNSGRSIISERDLRNAVYHHLRKIIFSVIWFCNKRWIEDDKQNAQL